MALQTGPKKPNATDYKAPERERERSQEKPAREETLVPRRTVHRNFSAGEGEQGRSAEFFRAAKELLEESKDPNALILQPDAELARKLSDTFGYVMYCTRVENDLMWHLFVFESKKLPVSQIEVKDRHQRNRNGDPVYNFESPTDAVDDSVIADFEEWLTNNVSITGSFFYTNVTVIPVEVDLSKENVTRALCYDGEDSNILLACVDEPFSAKMLNANSALRANLTFTPDTDKQDLTMMPMRSDFQLSVSEITRDKNASIIRNSGDKRTLISVDGYVNARWVGHNEPDRDGAIDLACYVPEVVATQSNPYHAGIFGGNYERSLLGLASMVYLQDNDIFLKGFEPSIHGGIPLSSLAYGMDTEVFNGKVPNDIDAVDEDPVQGEKWLSSIFHNDTKSRRIPVEYAILIKEGGVGYATSKLLLDVADDAPGAMEKLKEVLYNLTNGVSDELMDLRSSTDVIAGQVRLPMGYYTDKNGNRAAEFIDHRFMIDRLKDNYPAELDDYFACLQLEDREFSPAESMTKLVELYQLATGGTFVLKGMGTKLYLDPGFMELLATCIKDQASELNLELDANVELNFTRSRPRQGRHTSFGLSSSPLQRQRRTHTHGTSRVSGNRYRR